MDPDANIEYALFQLDSAKAFSSQNEAMPDGVAAGAKMAGLVSSTDVGVAMHGWTPFMGDSYPYEWIKTLHAAEKPDFDYAIGGHGGVMIGKQKFELWKQYCQDLMDQTAAAYSDGVSLAEAQKKLSAALVANYSGDFTATFPQDVGANVAKAYQVIAFPK